MLDVSRIWPLRPPGPLLGGTRSSPEASKRVQEASRVLQEASRGLQEASKSILRPPEQLPAPKKSMKSLGKANKIEEIVNRASIAFTCLQAASKKLPRASQTATRALPESPQRVPEASKSRPRVLQRPLGSLQGVPRGLQEPSKSLPGAPGLQRQRQDPPRVVQEASKRPFGPPIEASKNPYLIPPDEAVTKQSQSRKHTSLSPPRDLQQVFHPLPADLQEDARWPRGGGPAAWGEALQIILIKP